MPRRGVELNREIRSEGERTVRPPPLTVDVNSLGRELRDALGDLILARQQARDAHEASHSMITFPRQAKSLRESLRRKEEQNEFMRKARRRHRYASQDDATGCR